MKVTNLFPGTISGEGTHWKLPLIMLLIAFVACPLRAQAPPPEPPQAAVESTAQTLAPEALNELLAPIALYPDALIALILPASTVPADLVLAARYIASNGDPAQIANQPWDDSVKALARYPDLLKWMDQNLEWTTQVGETFLDQPADVMNSIQQLRAQAIAAGNLVDTPQQTIVKEVVEEETRVRIVPAEPEVIYVPQYDPEVVYVEPYAPDFGPVVTFGVGFAVGSWLNYDCDWGRRTVCVGDWRPGWRHDRNWDRDRGRDWDRDRDRDWDRGDRDRDWDRGNRGRDWAGGDRGRNNAFNVVNINNNTARVWQPSTRIQRQRAQRQRSYAANASNEYARAERRDGSGGGRRFGAVVKPSRPQFSDRAGDGDRQAWRSENSNRSASARTARGEIRKPNSNAPTVSPRTQRSRDQAARSGQGNAPREWKERGEGQRSDQSRGMVRQRPETPSIDESASQSDKIQARKWRSDSSSVKTSPPPSVNVDQTRSERFTPSYSKTNDSRRQSRAKEVDSSRSQGPSYSEAKKSPQASRVERSQGRSQRSAASYSSPDKPPQASRVERSQGRSQRSAASYSKPDKPPQASRVERSQGRSQRSAASYSKPDKPPQSSRVERSQGRSQRSAASYSKPNKPSQAARAERSQARSQRSAASYSKPNRSPQPSKAAQGKSGGGGGKKSSKKADKEQG